MICIAEQRKSQYGAFEVSAAEETFRFELSSKVGMGGQRGPLVGPRKASPQTSG